MLKPELRLTLSKLSLPTVPFNALFRSRFVEAMLSEYELERLHSIEKNWRASRVSPSTPTVPPILPSPVLGKNSFITDYSFGSGSSSLLTRSELAPLRRPFSQNSPTVERRPVSCHFTAISPKITAHVEASVPKELTPPSSNRCTGPALALPDLSSVVFQRTVRTDICKATCNLGLSRA